LPKLELHYASFQPAALMEVTPKEIRLRKKFLTESDRKRASRAI
jgi:predicted membrane GTPase involved in stress response